MNIKYVMIFFLLFPLLIFLEHAFAVSEISKISDGSRLHDIPSRGAVSDSDSGRLSLKSGVRSKELSKSKIDPIVHTEDLHPGQRLNLWLKQEKIENGLSAREGENICVLTTISGEGKLFSRVVGATDAGIDQEASIEIYTHLKSNKSKHILENPNVSIHFWLPKAKTQCNIQGVASQLPRHKVLPVWSRWKREHQLMFLALDPETIFGTDQNVLKRIKVLSELFPKDVPLQPEFVGYKILPQQFTTFTHRGVYGEQFDSIKEKGQWKTRKVLP